VNVFELATTYAAIGAVIAVIALLVRCASVDALLLLGLWPIYGPFLLLGGVVAADDRERELLEALRRAAATPLGAVLPDEATARALARRRRDAAARVLEIDAFLARPGTAALRAETVERTRRLRDRTRVELDEIDALIAQLVAQAELVRLSGAADPAAADLVRELVARVEGLDGLLAEE
jgi:hypothetical protein